MDSQGFVLLSVIANFKRIKSLTDDLDMVRHVCGRLRTVEYRPGEDGLDRLRKRDKWEQWVLSMETRDLSAQNDGPPPLNYSRPEMYVDGTSDARAQEGQRIATDEISLVNGSQQDLRSLIDPAAPYPVTNGSGINDTQFTQTPLSSVAPEFNPQILQMISDDNTTLEQLHQEDSFPDKEVESLVIVVRKPGAPTSFEPLFPSASSRTFSHGSIDGGTLMEDMQSFENRQPLSLRGGAASLEK